LEVGKHVLVKGEKNHELKETKLKGEGNTVDTRDGHNKQGKKFKNGHIQPKEKG